MVNIDFGWLLNDVDDSLVFMLSNGKEVIGNYQVKELLINGTNDVKVGVANINDLDSFISYATVRFNDTAEEANIIDIPVSKLAILYDKAGMIGGGNPTAVKLDDLDTFSVYDGKILKEGYAIYGYKVTDISPELGNILEIASNYGTMSTNDKIEALRVINDISYERNKALKSQNKGSK